MSRDIALETHTKDWIFDANGDLMMVDGPVWLHQRIMIRLLVPVGIYTGDGSEIIGSELHTILRNSGIKALDDVPLLIQEALSSMKDIAVDSIEVEMKDDGRTAEVHLQYHPTIMEEDVFIGELTPEAQTTTIEIS